ncbi:hypothetical protein ciss_22580 [Carboxydothermus islandicus]|uniref:DUF3842 domain-containing protein n=1 Tax=Carboxydothermus islandicus TaxID=661089 RepID=A0A1L8D565_9THEO|nr:DUF3842 family protein [Carboxydothermus islandicus]GAV26325.1 hypothetical protein ciss_22580 [Carboxydothermus islandicus]
MRIAVIDGQGGGIGKYIIERLRKAFGQEIEIIAIGTNSHATYSMLKAGANEGATGESALIYNLSRVDIILGPIGIAFPYGMLGEITPEMAKALSLSNIKKVLLPLARENYLFPGIGDLPLPHMVDELLELLSMEIQKRSGK